MGTLKGHKQNKDSNFKSDYYSIREFIGYVEGQKQNLKIMFNAERNGSTVLIDNKALSGVQTLVKSNKGTNSLSGILLIIGETPIFLDTLQYFDEWREVLNGVSSVIDGIMQGSLLIAGTYPVTPTPAGVQELTALKEKIRLLLGKVN